MMYRHEHTLPSSRRGASVHAYAHARTEPTDSHRHRAHIHLRATLTHPALLPRVRFASFLLFRGPDARPGGFLNVWLSVPLLSYVEPTDGRTKCLLLLVLHQGAAEGQRLSPHEPPPFPSSERLRAVHRTR